MKKILTFVAALAVTICASATDYAYSVLVNQTNGNKVEYKFEDMPVATFSEDNMVMNVGEQHVSYPIADIVNLTFDRTEKPESGVEGVASPDMTVLLSKENLDIRGLNPGVKVAVYDISGRMLVSANADADGSFSTSLSALGKGVFVITAGNNSFKIIR